MDQRARALDLLAPPSSVSGRSSPMPYASGRSSPMPYTSGRSSPMPSYRSTSGLAGAPSALTSGQDTAANTTTAASLEKAAPPTLPLLNVNGVNIPGSSRTISNSSSYSSNAALSPRLRGGRINRGGNVGELAAPANASSSSPIVATLRTSHAPKALSADALARASFSPSSSPGATAPRTSLSADTTSSRSSPFARGPSPLLVTPPSASTASSPIPSSVRSFSSPRFTNPPAERPSLPPNTTPSPSVTGGFLSPRGSPRVSRSGHTIVEYNGIEGECRTHWDEEKTVPYSRDPSYSRDLKQRLEQLGRRRGTSTTRNITTYDIRDGTTVLGESEEPGHKISQRDVEMVMRHSGKYDDVKAAAALEQTNGEVIAAILMRMSEEDPAIVARRRREEEEKDRLAEIAGMEASERRSQSVAEKSLDREAVRYAKPFLGFGLEEVSFPDESVSLIVNHVFRDGPAWNIGIRPGFEITHMQDTELTSLEDMIDGVLVECDVTGYATLRAVDTKGQSRDYELHLLTADEKFRNKPYFFDPAEHEVVYLKNHGKKK